MRDGSRPYSDIGARIAIAAVFMGVSRREFASRINASESGVSRWITGSKRITLDAALALRRETGLSLDWIYEGDPSNLPPGVASLVRDLA